MSNEFEHEYLSIHKVRTEKDTKTIFLKCQCDNK